MKILSTLLLVVIGAGSIGCTAGTAHESGMDHRSNLIAVDVLFTSQQCGRTETESTANWITDTAQLAQTYQAFKRSAFGGASTIPPAIDFSRDVVVLVTMGQRPTLGYGLVLSDAVAKIVEGHVEVVLEWREPSKGMMVGQMLTSPCVLIKLERGDYREVWIKDTQGQRRIVATKP